VGKSALIGDDNVYRNGAPRPMKMGTTRSLWRYDDVAYQAPKSENTPLAAIWHYATGIIAVSLVA
jgi:hypothetical protein